MHNLSSGSHVALGYRPGNQRKKVLIVDDEFLIRYSLQSLLEEEGFKAYTAETGHRALKSFEEENHDIVILDLRLPDPNGLTLLKKIKEINPSVMAIMITANPDIQSSVNAMKMGALDYLDKPIDMERLKSLLRTVKDVNPINRCPQGSFIFKSNAVKEIYRITEQLANKSDVTVLVLGESGTGKSFLCKTVHEASDRREKPFIEIGCSNIPEHLIESELFGYEKGAFTDAKVMKKGLVEMAEEGTLFFDEIGDMPYPMQSKLLYLIEERKFRRIGGLQNIHADIRIFAATNRNLDDLVQAKKFRLDLYYRLNVVTIEMPPLTDRKEDIPLLIQHFLQHYGEKYQSPPKIITARALEFLREYSWPGNIRELKNLVAKLVILSKSETIDIDDFPPNIFERKSTASSSKITRGASALADVPSSGLSLRAMEEEYIRTALMLAEGNQRKAAKLLDITRDTLRYRLKKLGIDSSRFAD